MTLWGGYYYIPSTDESEETMAQKGWPAGLLRGAPGPVVLMVPPSRWLLAAGCEGESEKRGVKNRNHPLPATRKAFSSLLFHFLGMTHQYLQSANLQSDIFFFHLKLSPTYPKHLILCLTHSSLNILDWRVFLLYLGLSSSLAEQAALEDLHRRTMPPLS